MRRRRARPSRQIELERWEQGGEFYNWRRATQTMTPFARREPSTLMWGGNLSVRGRDAPSGNDRFLRIPAVARRTYRSASRSGICVFPLLNGGREPQRGSAHAADLSPGSDKP